MGEAKVQRASLLLYAHGLLGLRWCLVPLIALAFSGSILVACHLAGQFATWSLAVLCADASRIKGTPWLAFALLVSCAALSCVPLLGLETVAAALLFFGLCGALGGCCGGLQAGLYVGFVLGEALLGVAVSGGLVFAASTLLADERGRIERDWLFLWCFICSNCVLSVLSMGLTVLLLVRCPQRRELQVVQLGDEEDTQDESLQPEPSKLFRSLRLGRWVGLTLCGGLLVGCSCVFLALHLFPPGQDIASLPQVRCSCFCPDSYADVEVTRDVQYGAARSGRDGDEEKLYLDVYRPARLGSKKAPAMLLIHGGNFMSSSKDCDIMVSEAFYFARAGFVVFNMDYRLDGSNYLVELGAVREAVHDAKAAVRFIASHAKAFGVDASRIAAWGESAGGIIATSMNSLASEGRSGHPLAMSNISAAVSISGTMWPFLVADPTNQPVPAVTPWFNVHSSKDGIVFPFLAVMTHTYLMATGVPGKHNRLVWVPGDHHVPWGPQASLDVSRQVRPSVFQFLKDVLSLPETCE